MRADAGACPANVAEDQARPDPVDGTVINRQVNLLIKILRGQSNHSGETLVKSLSGEVTENNAAVVVHALIALGRLDAVIEMARSRKRGDLGVRNAIWTAIGQKLRRESRRFTDADLEAINTLRVKEMARVPKQDRYDEAGFPRDKQ